MKKIIPKTSNMKCITLILILLFTSCVSTNKLPTQDIKLIKDISEEIGKTKYKISILYAYPGIDLDFRKIDSVYHTIK